MKYTRNAITQLKRQYKSVLLKCALINAALFMTAAPAMAVYSGEYDGESNTLTFNENAAFDSYNVNNVTLVNNKYIDIEGTLSNFWATIENNEDALIRAYDITNTIATFNNSGTVYADTLQNMWGTVNNNGDIELDELRNMNDFNNTGETYSYYLQNNGTYNNEGDTYGDYMENYGTFNNNNEVEFEEIENYGTFNNGYEKPAENLMSVTDAESSETNGPTLVAEEVKNYGTFNNTGSIEIVDFYSSMEPKMEEPEEYPVGAVYNGGTFLNGAKYDITTTMPEVDEEESTPMFWTMPEKIEYTLTSAGNGSIVGDVINQTKSSMMDDRMSIRSLDEDYYNPYMVSMMSNPVMQMMSGGVFYNNNSIEGNVYNEGIFYNGIEFNVTNQFATESGWPETTVTYTGNNGASIVADMIMNGNPDGALYSPYAMLSAGMVNSGSITAKTIFNTSVLHNGEINLMYSIMQQMYRPSLSLEPTMSAEFANVPEPTFFEGAEIKADTIYNMGAIFNSGTITGDIVNVNDSYSGMNAVVLADGKIDGNIISDEIAEEDVDASFGLYAKAHHAISIHELMSTESLSDKNLSGSLMAWSGNNEVTGGIDAAYTYVMEGANLKVGGDINTYEMCVGYPIFRPSDELLSVTNEEDSEPEISAASRLDIGANTVTAYDTYFGPESTLALTVKNEKEFGQIISGDFDIDEGAKLEVTVLPGFDKKNVDHTLQLLVLNDSMSPKSEEEGGFNNFTDSFLTEDGDEIAEGEDSVFENKMFKITRADNNGNYTFKQLRNAAELVDEKYKESAGAWLDNDEMASSGALELQEELAKIAQHQDGKELGEALEALAPKDTPAVQEVSSAVMGRVFGGIGAHLAKPQTGLSSGDALKGVSPWGSAYYGNAKLADRANNVYGFDADSRGITAGVDKQITSSIKLGLGLQYDVTDINAFKTDIDVDTTAVFGYGEYKPNNWFVSAMAAYGRSDYDEKKFVGSKTIKAHYAADLFGLQTTTGYDFATRYADITPSAGVRYNYIKRHDYEDTANQSISGSNSDVLTGVVGLRVAKRYGGFLPSAYVNFTYDFVSDRDSATVSLNNGTSYTTSGKRLNQYGTEAGVSLEYNYGSWDLTANYDYKARRHFQSHTGILSARYHF